MEKIFIGAWRDKHGIALDDVSSTRTTCCFYSKGFYLQKKNSLFTGQLR